MKTYLIIFALIIFSTVNIQAQQVTPYLDPTRKTDSGAAASWRFGSTLAIGGSTVINPVKSYAREKKDGKTVSNSEINSYSGLIALQTLFVNSVFTLELFHSPEYKEKIDREIGDDVTIKKKETQATLAGQFDKKFSLGYQYKEENIDESFKPKKRSISTNDLSISLRPFDWLYLTGGQKHIKEKESYKVANSWEDNYIGGSILAGIPRESQFRYEYSFTHSSKSVKDDSGGKLEKNEHPKTETSRNVIEVVLWRLLFSYELGVRKEYPSVNPNDEKISIETRTYGLGWIGGSGFILTGYMVLNELEDEFQNFERKSVEYRLNLGYNFF